MLWPSTLAKSLPEPMWYQDKYVQRGKTCHRLALAQTSPAQGSFCSQRNPGELCDPSTEPGPLPCPVLAPAMAAGAWKVPGFLCVFKTPQQQHPLARGQPQTQPELLSRVRAHVPFTGISVWQFSGCCDLHPEESSRLSRPSHHFFQGRWIGEDPGGNNLRTGVLDHCSG